MSKLLKTATMALLLMPVAAQADFSYSWFEVGYVADAEQGTLSGTESGDGMDFRLNFLAGETLYLTAHMDEVESDDGLQSDRFGFGIGIHNDPSASVGLYATLTYEDYETEALNDNGLGVDVGGRYNIHGEGFEIYGGLRYAEYDKLDGRFIYGGLVWPVTQNYAVVGEYAEGDFFFDDSGLTFDRRDIRIAVRGQF